MKVPKERTLAILTHDYQQFQASGGNVRNANPYFFEIPLYQVHTHVHGSTYEYSKYTNVGVSTRATHKPWIF